MNYKGLFDSNKNLLHELKNCVTAIRRQNYDKGIRDFRSSLPKMEQIMQTCIEQAKELQADGIHYQVEEIITMLKEILTAQEKKDYILLADLLELLWIPFVISLQQHLMEAAKRSPEGSRMLYPDRFAENMEYLQKEEPALYEKLMQAYQNIRVTDEAVYAFTSPAGNGYFMEETQTGDLTLRIRRSDREYYMHSNSDLYMEAVIFADAYTNVESEAYHILGFGKFYHVAAIVRKSLFAKKVHVYEPDLYVILINMMAEYYVPSFCNYLKLYHDPALFRLTEQIAQEPSGFIIHYPSLYNIEDEAIRNSFQKFFIAESAARNQELMLIINFQSNQKALQKGCENNLQQIEAFLPAMKGKDIYLIAAGPSLDKNIQELKNRKNAFILATGTVFYKLMRLGIRPDAVIITDANERVVWQIREHESETIPMLLLSTANRGFILQYKGPKYMIFQEGFAPAEKEAQIRESHLFQTGGSVSTTALDLALYAEPKRIIFLGLDLAFTNNQAHASDTSEMIAADPKELMQIKGFYGDTVLADQKFIIYREWIEKRIKEMTEKVEIINATEGGCYIEGISHLSLKQIL